MISILAHNDSHVNHFNYVSIKNVEIYLLILILRRE